MVLVIHSLSLSRPDCNFCDYRHFTATDDLGRFESKLAATAANSFKLNDYHALVIPKVREEQAEHIFESDKHRIHSN